MEQQPSDIPLNYTTIRTTQSRIAKSLLAIPVSLLDLFPKTGDKIYIVDKDGSSIEKKFSTYSSSTRECRIYGMKEFYTEFSIQDGDEIVIQKLDEGKYRLLPEALFRQKYQNALSAFENTEDEDSVNENLLEVKTIAHTDEKTVLENTFIKLSQQSEIQQRKRSLIPQQPKRGSVSPAMKRILQAVYEGKCQVSGFTFLKQDGNPYFEVHHICETQGDHPKNLLALSPNVHRQFHFATVTEPAYENGWLIYIRINEAEHKVFQRIDLLQKEFQKEVHY
ncbi:hypothetical protein FACS189427_01360 [Planctomycetales bacterium]|nr:hypothetical protein FACS189427_01360 [Planctomycetales bacterium]